MSPSALLRTGLSNGRTAHDEVRLPEKTDVLLLTKTWISDSNKHRFGEVTNALTLFQE